jgi:hypothetical protein
MDMCEKTHSNDEVEEQDGLTFDTYEGVVLGGDQSFFTEGEILDAMHGVLREFTTLAQMLGLTLEDIAYHGIDKQLSK